MAHYKMSDVAIEISQHENNPKQSEYTKFVGLEHYVSGEVLIRDFGSTKRLESSMKVFQSGDVLVARRNVYLRRAATADFDGLTSGDSIVLRAKNQRFGHILPFVLNTDEFWDFADRHSDGTMSKRLSPKTLLNYEFNLPDEEKLDALSEILWAIDKTRNAYKKLIQRTDDLVKSQFIEMFDNPDTPIVSIGEISSLVTKGTTPTTLGFEFVKSGINFIKVENITEARGIAVKDLMHVSAECHEKLSRSQLREGDILFSIAGAIGRIAVVSSNILPANTNQAFAIIRIKPDYPIDTLYLLSALESPFVKRQYEEMQRGIAQINLSLKNIADLMIPLPAKDRQEEFVKFVRQSDKSKSELRQSLAALTATYKRMISENLI